MSKYDISEKDICQILTYRWIYNNLCYFGIVELAT